METKSIGTFELEEKRKALLETYRKKQSFRVSIGKSSWVPYESFNPAYDLREILNDECVIEFDTTDKDFADKAINATAVNLYRSGLVFQIWSHGGRSMHIHIHDLPITPLIQEERTLFKKVFIRKIVDKEFLPLVDISLTGTHLIALEWQKHWKGCYGIKELIYEFNPQESNGMILTLQEVKSFCEELAKVLNMENT